MLSFDSIAQRSEHVAVGFLDRAAKVDEEFDQFRDTKAARHHEARLFEFAFEQGICALSKQKFDDVGSAVADCMMYNCVTERIVSIYVEWGDEEDVKVALMDFGFEDDWLISKDVRDRFLDVGRI